MYYGINVTHRSNDYKRFIPFVADANGTRSCEEPSGARSSIPSTYCQIDRQQKEPLNILHNLPYYSRFKDSLVKWYSEWLGDPFFHSIRVPGASAGGWILSKWAFTVFIDNEKNTTDTISKSQVGWQSDLRHIWWSNINQIKSVSGREGGRREEGGRKEGGRREEGGKECIVHCSRCRRKIETTNDESSERTVDWNQR